MIHVVAAMALMMALATALAGCGAVAVLAATEAAQASEASVGEAELVEATGEALAPAQARAAVRDERTLPETLRVYATRSALDAHEELRAFDEQAAAAVDDEDEDDSGA